MEFRARIRASPFFQGALFVTWEFEQRDDTWTHSGEADELTLVGGRAGGFRTYTFSDLATAGRYRVRVNTRDGREVGHTVFRFTVGKPKRVLTRRG